MANSVEGDEMDEKTIKNILCFDWFCGIGFRYHWHIPADYTDYAFLFVDVFDVCQGIRAVEGMVYVHENLREAHKVVSVDKKNDC